MPLVLSGKADSHKGKRNWWARTRHAASVRQRNWLSVGTGLVPKATQEYPPRAPPELSRNVLHPVCGSVGPCSIRSRLSWRTLVASLVRTRVHKGRAGECCLNKGLREEGEGEVCTVDGVCTSEGGRGRLRTAHAEHLSLGDVTGT